MAVSQKNDGVFWTHNDSGDENKIYAFNQDGQHLGEYYLENCSARDWEDMAVGPGPENGENYLYIGEIGDNSAQYDLKYVYRVKEPALNNNQSPENEILENVDIIAFQYEDGNRDAETLMIDSITNDIFIVSKRESFVQVYRLPYPQSTESINQAELVGSLDIYPNENQEGNDFGFVVAGDISSDGTEILLKTYAHIFHFSWDSDGGIMSALSNEPFQVEYQLEPQGEAVAWHPDGFGYFTLSEELFSIPTHLFFYPRIVGCMNSESDNYNPYALEDDGTCADSTLLGDVNADGVINVLDVVMLIDFILNSEYIVLGDLNGDGNMDILDVVLLVNIILGE